ncbi:MAG: tryptophan synthase subunit alpha [Eubacteriales bacterium]|nr:tryptophan synthase subunit alpha [Eubacteriales bacterium]
MSKIRDAFSNNKKAFIPFITAGDPDMDTTSELVIRMAEAGADIIEIGIPFSDPVSEGPAIQKADIRALAGGASVDAIFRMVGKVRKSCDVPLALMTYMNPVFVYGSASFINNCGKAGVNAVIVPDLPYEEKGELLPFCLGNNVDLISMIAPTSSQRIRMIAREAMGFLYCVSSMGVTGVRSEIGGTVSEMVRTAREVSNIPCSVGFGISTPEQAAVIGSFADGIIVGSAIVGIIERYGRDCVPHVADYVRMMKKAISFP